MTESRFTPLLIALLLTFIPFAGFGLPLIDTVFKVLLILGGTYAVARARRHIGLLIAFVSPVIALQVAPEVFGGPVPQILAIASGLTFLTYITTLTIRGILRSQSITRDVLMGGVAGYLLLGYAWGLAYMLAHLLEANAFNVSQMPPAGLMSTMRYFSFVTLTSLGFGDVVPTGIISRQLAVLEAVAGQVYLTVFIGRLLGVSIRKGSDAAHAT